MVTGGTRMREGRNSMSSSCGETDMRPMRWIVVVMLAWSAVFAAPVRAAAPPPVELVDVYHGGVDLSRYWVSEKYDGVRGYWDGHQLFTRGGTVVHVPAWFTKNWPKTPLDGELWAGYGKFARASAIVRTAGANDPAWHEITYHVLDRKSTRLNSSHPSISYAVFCLKKKKRHRRNTRQ